MNDDTQTQPISTPADSALPPLPSLPMDNEPTVEAMLDSTSPVAVDLTQINSEQPAASVQTQNPNETEVMTAIPGLPESEEQKADSPALGTDTVSEMPSVGMPVPEVPLAFAGAKPITDDVPTTPVLPVGDPIVPPTPLPTKQKSGLGKVMFMVVGLLMLLGGLGFGGYYYYGQSQLEKLPETATISAITEQRDCKGCSGGYQLKWLAKSAKCKVTTIPCDPTGDPNGTPLPNTKAACEATGHSYWCAGCNGFCIPDTYTGGGCDGAQLAKCGQPVVRGAQVVACKPTGGDVQRCDCELPSGAGMVPVCFSATGMCVHPVGVGGNPDGLCDYVYQQYLASPYPLASGQPISFSCDETGCTVGAGCTLQHYYCDSNATGTAGCTDANGTGGVVNSTVTKFDANCGTEQIDVYCGGTVFTSFKSKIYPNSCDEPTPKHSVCNHTTYACETVDGEGADECAGDADCVPSATPTPSPTPAPVLSCTDLSKDKADSAIAIGTVVKLTCVGSVVPAGATSLSYQFRWNVNGGAWNTLTSSGDTANLTISACGTYATQCKVCGIIGGQLVCDPTWTATQ